MLLFTLLFLLRVPKAYRLFLYIAYVLRAPLNPRAEMTRRIIDETHSAGMRIPAASGRIPFLRRRSTWWKVNLRAWGSLFVWRVSVTLKREGKLLKLHNRWRLFRGRLQKLGEDTGMPCLLRNFLCLSLFIYRFLF